MTRVFHVPGSTCHQNWAPPDKLSNSSSESVPRVSFNSATAIRKPASPAIATTAFASAAFLSRACRVGSARTALGIQGVRCGSSWYGGIEINGTGEMEQISTVRKTKICCWHKQNSYLRAEPIGNSDGKRPDPLWSPPGISFSPPSRPPGSSAPPQGSKSTLGDGRSPLTFPAGRWSQSSRRKHRIFRNPPVRRRIVSCGEEEFAAVLLTTVLGYSPPLVRQGKDAFKVETRNPPPSTKDPAPPFAWESAPEESDFARSAVTMAQGRSLPKSPEWVSLDPAN